MGLIAIPLVPFLSLAAVFFFCSLAFRRDGCPFGVWILPIVIGVPVLYVPLAIVMQFHGKLGSALFFYSTVIAPPFAVVFSAAMAARFPHKGESMADG